MCNGSAYYKLLSSYAHLMAEPTFAKTFYGEWKTKGEYSKGKSE